MEIKKTTLHEAVKKSVTLSEVDIDTQGDDVELYVYLKDDVADPGILIGTAPGQPVGTDILFPEVETQLMEENTTYVIEAWINPDSEDRKCVYPEDHVIHEIRIQNRRRVNANP